MEQYHDCPYEHDFGKEHDKHDDCDICDDTCYSDCCNRFVELLNESDTND